MLPLQIPQDFKKFGLSIFAGVLLYGPPGCGKTLVAKAVAKESGASFISIKGPELLSKYVGSSEKAIRQVFQRARASPPCVIFFDELDALAPRRGMNGDGNQVSERVVNTLLTELDSASEKDNNQIFVIAATNRPAAIDEALLRNGRLGKILEVGIPDEKGRQSILQKHLRNTPGGKDLNINEIANKAEGFSGADLAALVREAVMCLFQRTPRPENFVVTQDHFNEAFKKITKSVEEPSKYKLDRDKKRRSSVPQ